MLKKFLDGVLFGSGFSVAALIFSYFGLAYFILPNSEPITYSTPSFGISEPPISSSIPVQELSFRELSIDEKIEKASVIAVAEYQLQEDGMYAAIITEILKKDDGVEFFYSIGNEYIQSSYYPAERENRGDGVIMFFSGNPATMHFTTTYRGERITGLADIPIALFRQKCQQ